MKLLHVVGARPNFPKLAPVCRAARAARTSCHFVPPTDGAPTGTDEALVGAGVP